MKLDQIIAVRTNKKVYRDENVIIKLFDENYAASDVLNEALNHARAEETGLRVPKLVEVLKIDGKWAIVLEYIEGKTLQQLMNENPAKKEEYLKLFVDLQMEIHTMRSPLMTKLRDKMRRKISESKLDATTRYDLHTRLEAMPRHAKLCHGDFNPSNVIVTEAGECFVIDWAHATQGNASADVARTYLMFCLSGEEKLAEQYLNLFCKKADTAKQYVQKWLPIVAASQSVKGNPAEQELLLRWASVVDYE
ncbi:MAG: phosphotransferase [Clostridia bacterium]|nr:phosphotransferase [Clostridia bacterium]